MSQYRHIGSLRGPQGDQGPAGIGSHGVLSSPTNMNNLRGEGDIGIYTARADNLTGAPELEGDNPLVTLEVLWGISNGVTQRITSRDEMWWRSASSSSAWDQWRRVGADPIVATDRYVELPEGRSLYVIDQRHRAYDFPSFPAEMNRIPDGAGGVWNTNTDESLLDGRGIRQGGGAHSTIAWAATAGFTNGDILTRMQRNTFGTTANSALMVRLSETGGSTSGYNVYVATLAGESRLAIGSRDAGSQAVLQSQAVNIAEGDVFYIRFNLDGDLLRARAWLDGEPEPETWLLSVQDDTHTTGLVGFQSGTNSAAWDVLSINESGGPAA